MQKCKNTRTGELYTAFSLFLCRALKILVDPVCQCGGHLVVGDGEEVQPDVLLGAEEGDQVGGGGGAAIVELAGAVAAAERWRRRREN